MQFLPLASATGLQYSREEKGNLLLYLILSIRLFIDVVAREGAIQIEKVERNFSVAIISHKLRNDLEGS